MNFCISKKVLLALAVLTLSNIISYPAIQQASHTAIKKLVGSPEAALVNAETVKEKINGDTEYLADGWDNQSDNTDRSHIVRMNTQDTNVFNETSENRLLNQSTSHNKEKTAEVS